MPNTFTSNLTTKFMLITLRGKSVTKSTTSYKAAAEALYQTFGTDALIASKKIYPRGFDQSYKTLCQAYKSVRTFFDQQTAPYGDGSQRGVPRLILLDSIADGSFMRGLERLLGVLDTARLNFADDLETLPSRIEASGSLGSAFNAQDYPTPDQIRNGFQYTIEGPTPLTDPSLVSLLPLPQGMAAVIQESLVRDLNDKIHCSQQRLLNDLLTESKALTDAIVRAAQWDGKGRKPPIRDALKRNLMTTLAQGETYALPDTPEGQQLMETISKIKQNLITIKIDCVKSSTHYAQQAAQQAQEAITC